MNMNEGARVAGLEHRLDTRIPLGEVTHILPLGKLDRHGVLSVRNSTAETRWSG